MTEEPMRKKMRIWNPAINDSANDEKQNTNDEKPVDCRKNVLHPSIPAIFQNYFQLAPIMLRMQQQRQYEEIARRQLMSQISAKPSPSSSSTSSSSSSSWIRKDEETLASNNVIAPNPIVANVLGTPLVNENCCAVCGASFRLTGDLVQHMRNNHRKSKFKRKSDLKLNS